MRALLRWAAALALWEIIVLVVSYFATVNGPKTGRLYGATYREDPMGWFAMTAMWVHVFAAIATIAVGAVVWSFWTGGNGRRDKR